MIIPGLSIRNTAEGLEVLCYQPSDLFEPAIGCVMFGTPNPIRGIEACYPLSAVSSVHESMLSGSIDYLTSALPPGSSKVGFPAGFSATSIDDEQLSLALKSRYGLSPAKITAVTNFVNTVKVLETSKPATLEGSELESYNSLLNDPSWAALIPNLFSSQLEVVSETIKDYHLSDLVNAIANHRIGGKVFVPEKLVDEINSKCSELMTGSEAIRSVRHKLFVKLLSSFSSAGCFTKYNK